MEDQVDLLQVNTEVDINKDHHLPQEDFGVKDPLEVSKVVLLHQVVNPLMVGIRVSNSHLMEVTNNLLMVGVDMVVVIKIR